MAAIGCCGVPPAFPQQTLMNHPTLRYGLLSVGASLFWASSLFGQSFVGLTEVRNPANPYTSLFQIEAGAIGTFPTDEDAQTGQVDDISWDGHIYYRNAAYGPRRATLEAYGGRDGLFAGWYDSKFIGDQTVTRLELRARPWLFYRDGTYRGSQFVPNGLYEGSDYEAYLGFGRESQPGLYFELGPYYRHHDFRRGNLTRFRNDFVLPDDFAAYGARIYAEQGALEMDRRRGMPRGGYILTLQGEREWNNSSGEFGGTTSKSELPDAVFRARGRLEWYIPASDMMNWEIFARGGWADDSDRIINTESMHALGSQWADAQLRLRIHFGSSFTVTPFVQGQFSRVPKEFGLSTRKKLFFGAGVESYFHLSDMFSVHGFYSFLDNEVRESIRIDEDVHGQHLFYLGLVMRFGSTGR